LVEQQVIKELPSVEEAWKSLFWWQKVEVIFGGRISLGKYSKPGWSGELDFFIFRCSRCGNLDIDYPHGFKSELCCHHCS